MYIHIVSHVFSFYSYLPYPLHRNSNFNRMFWLFIEHTTITDKLSNRIDYNFYCQRLKWIKVTWNSEIVICIEYKESNNNNTNYNNSKEQKNNRLWVACDLWNRVKKKRTVVYKIISELVLFFFHSNRILSKWIIESNRSKCTQSQMIRAAWIVRIIFRFNKH